MQVNLEWFRTFKVIYETGTLSSAAKQMSVSQPGVGLHLNALETYTGYPLFERTTRKMIPTERGHLLYQQMFNSLNTLVDIESRFRRKSGFDRPTVSVGMCMETFQQALEKHIPSLDFNLIIQFQESDRLMDSLENGSVDLVMTTQSKESNIVEYEPFAVEQLMIVCGKNTDISSWDKVDKTDKASVSQWFLEQIWYNTASDMKLLNQFWKANFDKMPDFIPNFIVPNKFSIIRCLATGEGLAVLPDFISSEAIEKGEIRILWKGFNNVKNTMYLGQRKNTINVDKISFLKQKLIEEFRLATDIKMLEQ